jgi:ribosomal protein S18 acetylase RimI-like enzyme
MTNPQPGEPITLRPASQFTLKQLTIIYNQTRVDYLVPMPMNMAKMAEYIQVYNIDRDSSYVALEGERMIALGMLGVRQGRAWITRLGVVPGDRRHGLGLQLMNALHKSAERLGLPFTMLEVIKNNAPAHKLFLKLGYREVGELLILRRPPGPSAILPTGTATWLARADALALLETRTGLPPWTNQNDSIHNATEIYGLHLTLPDGGEGWLVYQRQRFMMSRFVIHTVNGDPAAVGRALLAQLHERFFDLDTQTENIYVTDPHLPAFYELGYVVSFRRIEMHRGEIIL